MQVLVRRTIGDDKAEVLDTPYRTDVLIFGDSEKAIMPLVCGGELRIAQNKVTALQLPLRVNGSSVGSSRITAGDLLEIPGYQITVIKSPSGFDLALQVEITEYSAPASTPGVIADPWSIRKASWLALAITLLVCLVLPFTGVISDEIWSTGALASAHQTAGIAKDCKACHTQPFVTVRDGACLACHRIASEHVDLQQLALGSSSFSADHFTETRCASCHREHNEPTHLVSRDDGQCTDCHALEGHWTNEVQSVSSFSQTDHPPFRLALLEYHQSMPEQQWRINRAREHSEKLQENSQLKFPHDIHLDPDKVRTADTDQSLQCDSCHVLEDAGEHFEAITMDRYCRDCHSLSFDPFEPEIELPHGDVRAAVIAMEAHFIREFTDPVLRAQRASKKPRRVPNKRQAAQSCEGDGLQCGRSEAVKEASYQFSKTGCVSCHMVTDTGLDDISDRWLVNPVRINGDWYPHSRFDHRAHLNLALAEDGGEICLSCHQASTSNQAQDILIPGQTNCLQCHDNSNNDTPTDCVACHAFHQHGASPAVNARLEEAP